MYHLNGDMKLAGLGTLRKCLFASEDLSTIKEKLKEKVLEGTPIKELSITKEIEFEFKCAIQMLDEDKENEK